MLNKLIGVIAGSGANNSRDNVVIFSETRMDIYPVIKKTETEIHTANHVFPVQDAATKINPAGGLYYIYNACIKYLTEVEHLKEVENNLAIKNMFNFGDQDRKADIKFYVMLAAIVIIVFLLK